jgi:hypothetical protein
MSSQLAFVVSKNNVPIRLTEERWAHIAEEHGELTAWQAEVLATVKEPSRIVAGGAGELLAVREIEPGKWLVVVYRETNGDGFIITAFFTRRTRSLDRREQLWP